MAELGLRELALGDLVEGELHGRVAVALGVADGRDRAGAGLDHGHGDAGPVLREELGHPDLLADDRRHAAHLDLDLDVDARGERVEALEAVDRLRGRLVDVDQPLVRPDLEVLARVLVLERRADHAVDVLLRRQRNGPGDGRAGALGRVHDLARRAIDRVVVVRLQANPDLVGGECRHFVLLVSRLSA